MSEGLSETLLCGPASAHGRSGVDGGRGFQDLGPASLSSSALPSHCTLEPI